MAAFPLALNYFPSLLHSHPAPTPPVLFSSGSPRRLVAVGTRRPVANWRCSCFGPDPVALLSYIDVFHGESEQKLTKEKRRLPPFIHLEFKARFVPEGLLVVCYMAGVRKVNVKVRVEKEWMIVQGKRDKLFDGEDDADTEIGYKFIPAPPRQLFNVDATTAEIKDGMLRVLVPHHKT